MSSAAAQRASRFSQTRFTRPISAARAASIGRAVSSSSWACTQGIWRGSSTVALPVGYRPSATSSRANVACGTA